MIEEQEGIYSANRGSKRIRRQPKRYIDDEASYQSSEEQVKQEKPGRRSNKQEGNCHEEKDASSQDQFSQSGSGQDSNESSIAPVIADVFKSKNKSQSDDVNSDGDDLAHQASDSDGMGNLDEIEDYNEHAMERQQATEPQVRPGQNGASAAYPIVMNGRAPRQAQIAGQKRTHKLCQMEKRSNDDDDEDFDLDDSSADEKQNNARQRSKPEGNQGYGDNDSLEEDVEISRPTKARAVIDEDYMKQITANTFVEDKKKRVSNRRNGVEGAALSQKLNSSVMHMITTDQKQQAVTQKEFEQRVKDEGIKGCFEKHEARAVKQILNMPQPDKKTKRHLDTTCLMSWWPSQDDPDLTPFDSEVPYQQARKECPKLLVEYFQRRTKLV